MNEDRRIGQRAGIRWAIAWLHKQSNEMNDPRAKAIINAAAHGLGVDEPKGRLTCLSNLRG